MVEPLSASSALAVQPDQRVVVHVDHPGFRYQALHHLVRVTHGGQPGADVDELADALFGDPPGGALMEAAIGPGRVPDLGDGLQDLLRRSAVGREVVAAS